MSSTRPHHHGTHRVTGDTTIKTLIAAAATALTVAGTALAPIAPAAHAHIGDYQGPSDGMHFVGVSPSGSYQVRATTITSTPFAMSTMRAAFRYQDAHGLSKGERFSVKAYSTVTHRSYTMRCKVATGFLAQIDCVGGTRAHVRMVAAG